MSTRIPTYQFREMHPSPTAKHGERLGLTTRYKCKQCGFPVNSQTKQRKAQEGIFDGVVISGTLAANNMSIDALTGCPHCGTFNWSSKVSVSRAPEKQMRGRTASRRFISLVRKRL